MLLLNVPYEEKDEAKSLGAKWNPELKKWYIQNTEDCGKFMKWIWKDYKDYEELYILKDHLYIAEGIRICNKCKKETRVIGLGIDKYYQVYDENEDYNFSAHLCEEDDIEIGPITEDLPKQILDYCMNNWNFKKTFSKTIRSSYLANCCDNCNSLQGNHFLFSEVDTPFVFFDVNKAKNLKLHEIKFKYDIPVRDYEESYDSTAPLIRQYSKFDYLFEV
ncbi:MAG: hypothetical protein J5527_11815 [Treponema sp.]|nr:hypothetical protein [Treponema sp.]